MMVKLCLSSFDDTLEASDLSSRLRASRWERSRSKRSRFDLVARSALPCGSRKFRAKPSLTLTTSPIWPRRPMRSNNMTCMGVLLVFVVRLFRAGWETAERGAFAQAKHRLGQAKNCDHDHHPSDQDNSEIESAEQQGAVGEPA